MFREGSMEKVTFRLRSEWGEGASPVQGEGGQFRQMEKNVGEECAKVGEVWPWKWEKSSEAERASERQRTAQGKVGKEGTIEHTLSELGRNYDFIINEIFWEFSCHYKCLFFNLTLFFLWLLLRLPRHLWCPQMHYDVSKSGYCLDL